MNEKIDKIQQDIENSSDIKPYIIDVSFVESHSGKVMHLLNSIGESYEYNIKTSLIERFAGLFKNRRK